jgi:hypothetical protein
MTLRLLVRRMLALLRTRRLEAELDGEVRAHLEMAERDALAAGLSPEDARRAARRAFGSIERMKEEHRDRRSARWIHRQPVQTCRSALLRDARHPGSRRPRVHRARSPGAPRVAVVNEALARQLATRFGVSDPKETVGGIVSVMNPMYENRGQSGTKGDVEIVGVIRNERVRELDAPTPEVVYIALLQSPRREIKLIVRTRNDPSAATPAIREAVRQIDPRLPLGDVRTMQQVKQRTLSAKTEPAWIIGAFAGIAALLAALGSTACCRTP